MSPSQHNIKLFTELNSANPKHKYLELFVYPFNIYNKDSNRLHRESRVNIFTFHIKFKYRTVTFAKSFQINWNEEVVCLKINYTKSAYAF